MAQEQNISTQLSNLLVTRNYSPEMLDRQGRPANAEDAKTFTFDYVSGSGKNYGTMVVILDSDNDMKVFYGDNLGRAMEGDDKDEFFDFQQQLNKFARMHRWTYTAKDLNQLKHTMQGLAAIQEGLFEGYYGTRRVSYAGEPTEARLMIRHNRNLGEADARFRYVESLYIETAESERFKLPFKNLSGGRAMLEHVRQGGNPYDVRGVHIAEMVQEIATLSRFNRASATRVLEGATQQLITEAQAYYKSLRENMKRLASPRGYQAYFEAWHPAVINDQQELVEDIKTLFIEQTLDTRIEAALPLLARIQQQGTAMKEAEIFENWANRLVEGTWALPETPEAKQKLADLLVNELPVGPDATNATEQLYDILGDDKLFDALGELADQDANADARDTIIYRMRELGLEIPGAQDKKQSEVDEGLLHRPGQEHSPVAQAITRRILMQRTDLLAKYGPEAVGQAIDEVADFVGDVDEIGSSDVSGWIRHVEQMLGNMDQSVAEGLSRMAQLAGVVAEGRILDESGETLDHILARFKHEVKRFEDGDDLDSDLYEALFDYYSDLGAIPYGTIKGRTGDPYEWVTDKLDQELGTGNYAKRLPEADNISTFEEPLDEFVGIAAVGEGTGTCNSTMEGEYCPKHGLAECGMYEMSTVAGSMAPVVGEGHDDPINYNGAITGSYYEGKQDPLERLKTLARGQ